LPKQLIADKGYDSDKLVDWLSGWNVDVVIPPRAKRNWPRLYDKDAYKSRNKIERLINKLKQYRRLATRYDKTRQSYLALFFLASILIWLNF
jgi:transposase